MKRTKYNIYDVVTSNRGALKERLVVLDYDFRPYADGVQVVYEVWSNGRSTWIPEPDLKYVERLPATFKLGDLVSVSSEADQLGEGEIIGEAWDPESGEWEYTVRLCGNEVLSCSPDEMKPAAGLPPTFDIEGRSWLATKTRKKARV